MEEKYYYCTRCKCYPDEIRLAKSITEDRKWDGDCYELIGAEDNEQENAYCGSCGAELIEK